MNTVTMSEGQLVKTIRAHLAKAEQLQGKANDHFVAAGIHIKTLKAQHDGAGGTWAQWEEKLRTQLNLGKSRASELMQIADGRKTDESNRAETAQRVAKHRKSSPLRNGESRDLVVSEPDNGAEVRAEWGDAPPDPEAEGVEFVEHIAPEVAAALQAVERMSEESRDHLFSALQDRYDHFGHLLYEWQNDLDLVHTIIMAIGADRTRALGKKIPGLILRAVGRAALPDCGWCGGAGFRTAEYNGHSFKAPCECTRRKRSEEDFAALQARIDRENEEQQIPQQDFSYGLEVTTKDGKVWASGVRLPTEEEAKFYIDYWARRELKKHGYKTWEDEPGYGLLAFDIKRHAEPPMMKVSGGKRKTLNFLHGTCGLLGARGWHPISGGDCDCGGCRAAEKDREDRKRLHQNIERAERALQAGEISQKQYDEWMDSPCNKDPEWLARLRTGARDDAPTMPVTTDPLDDIPAFLDRTRSAS
jgi:hypothetical protein